MAFINGKKVALERHGALHGQEQFDNYEFDEEAVNEATGYESWDLQEFQEEHVDLICSNNKFHRYVEDLVKKRLDEEIEKRQKKKLSQSTMDVTKK